ncbi:hypothetical protein JKY79_02040 [Candidatus Babeliales bacterium]|nr:hypothetical protein [Candidatus Babeliales bacterium]
MKKIIIGFLYKSLLLFFLVGIYGGRVQAASQPMPLITLSLESDESKDVINFFQACMDNDTKKAQEIFNKNKKKQIVLNDKQYKMTHFLINNFAAWDGSNGKISTLQLVSEHGNIDLCRLILPYIEEMKKILPFDIINYQTDKCVTALELAVNGDHKECVILLLRYGAIMNERSLMYVVFNFK